MKKLSLLLSVLTLVLTGLFTPLQAQRVLTDEERQTIQGDTHFLEKCQFAARNYASYWSIHDGSGLANEAARIKWAKDRINAVRIVKDGVQDPKIAERFVTLAKGIQFSIGAAPVDSETIIAAWVSGNRFDEIASQYFDILGDGTDMSVSGN